MEGSAPICPCCFKQYSADLLAAAGAASSGTTTEKDNSSFFSNFCGVCLPSDIEKTLAKKNELPNPPIEWLLTVDEIEKKTKEVVNETTENLNTISCIPLNEVTFENTILPLMLSPNYKTNPYVAACKFLQHCSPNKEIRDIATQAGAQFSSTRVDALQRKDVYERVLQYSKTKEYNETISDYNKHFVDSIIKKYRRAGLALTTEEQSKLKLLLKEDSDYCSEFSKNLSNDTTELFFTKDELVGLPENFIDERIHQQGDDGNDNKTIIKVNIKYPDLIPVTNSCDISTSRKKMIFAREGPDCNYKQNLELVVKGITIRKQIATILGYDSWASYICENRMTGSSLVANQFCDELHEKLKGPAQLDLQRLIELKKKHLSQKEEENKNNDKLEVFDNKINAWDVSYYTEKLLKEEYNVDHDAIKEYFPLHHVVNETLKIYQELLGLTFIELQEGTYWKWHSDVQCFLVKDSDTDKPIGHFYLDLHPREGKYGHAAIFHLVKHTADHGAVDCMLCNLPKSTKTTPSLLRHSNVITFFHEFGHIMHGLCSEGIGNSTTLAKCPRDFVEAPSQMLENWVWCKDILNKLSCHYKTKDVLPEDKINELINAKNVMVALNTCRQIYLSKLDLLIHGIDPPKTTDELQNLVNELRQKLSLIENPPGCNMLRTFGHLMNQYSASYYGYMWAECLSADMFVSRFEKEGVMNKQTGMEYRKFILAPGGVHNINDHLIKFLGRKPSQDSFLKSRGIL